MSRAPGPAAPRGEHASFDELAVGWALHALEPEEEALFGAHLPGCGRCGRTVGETTEVMVTMAAALPPARPSPHLRARIAAAAEHTEQVPRPSAPGVPRAGGEADPAGPPPALAPGFPGYDLPLRAAEPPAAWRRVLPHALLAAGVAAILALGTWVVVLSTARDEAAAAAARQAAIVQSLLRPGEAVIAPVDDAEGHPVATVVARDGQVQVVTHGLAVNDQDATTYVLWRIGGGAPVALGTFDVTDPRTGLQTVGSGGTGTLGPTGFGISLEPGREAPAEPSDIIAEGQVAR